MATHKKVIPQLKDGDQLYRHVTMSGIWTYTVFGVQIFESVVQYVVRCESCTHGWKCELLIAENDYGSFSYVAMLNNDEDDDQRGWHNGDGYLFRTKPEAHLDAYNKLLTEANNKITVAEKSLKNAEIHRDKIVDAIELAKADALELLKQQSK